ncbi:MAG: alpha-maltose-phosphate synthase [Acidobacteriota bacterium]|jgi:glycosyltransferase involved in cell wall biosynthesis
MKRLLTIGHSYVVTLNRRLADEMARQGSGRWDVTVAAPAEYHGDLRPVRLDSAAGEACALRPLAAHLTRSPHLMFYGGLRALLSEHWDVIHCWEEPYVASCAQIAALAGPDVPLVFATFQNLAKRYPPPFNWIERRVLRRADGWIAFGKTIHDTQLTRHGYADVPSRMIPPGVDTTVFAPDALARNRIRAERGWTEDVAVVGYLGRFVPEKGLSVLAAALRQVTGPWRALFVGGGPGQPALEALAAAHPGRVSIATDVAHEQVPDYLNAMDVLCAPSQTTPRWREQFGRMLIEAMACGVPVLASRSGEIPYVLGDAGILLAEDDEQAWAAALDGVLENLASRRALADRGLRRARTEFAWPVVARRHLDFFDELVASA